MTLQEQTIMEPGGLRDEGSLLDWAARSKRKNGFLKRFQIVALKLESIQKRRIAVNQEGRASWTASSHRRIAAAAITAATTVRAGRHRSDFPVVGRRIAEKSWETAADTEI